MRRIAVLGAGRPLGARVADALRPVAGDGRVVRIEREEGLSGSPRRHELSIIAWSPDHRALGEFLRKERIDTVVDCALVEDRTGASRRASGADVISAMCVGAAVAHADSPVRSWVMASSTAFYPIASYSPLFHLEDGTRDHGPRLESESIAEAEEYARSVARRRPAMNVATLRLQELVGPGIRGPLASLFRFRRLPRLPGFDPPMQLLHVDDAVAALAFAVEHELAGVYNVASRGALRWSEVARRRGQGAMAALPLPVEDGRGWLASFGLALVDPPLFDWLRYGQAVDTAKLARAGWSPAHDQLDCLDALAD